jgi:hypothetical protein
MIFTYFFHEVETGLTKIGKSRHPSNRLKWIQSREKKKLIPLKILKGDKEKSLHQKHAEFRVKGEWFLLPKEMTDPWLKKPVKDINGFPKTRTVSLSDLAFVIIRLRSIEECKTFADVLTKTVVDSCTEKELEKAKRYVYSSKP